MKTMKKILSVVLALLLMTATFAVAASAATTETPVGSADTGVEDFGDTTSNNQTINVTVKEVQHRYAVDLEFSFDDLTIDSDIVWNVKDLKYDVGKNNLDNSERTIKVTNRSDMPVYAYATATDGDEEDGVTVTTSHTAGSRLEVAKAAVGTGNTEGTATSKNITVSLKSDSWQNVAAYYAAKSIDNKTQTFTLTTVTVTISKSASAS